MLKRYSAFFVSLLVTSAVITSCANEDYDLKNLEKVNTDISFGGDNLALPIGSFKPVTLGQFLKPGELIKVVDGNYQINYTGNNTNSIAPINPIDFSVSVPEFTPVTVDFSGISITDIDLPLVSINTAARANIPAATAGVSVTQATSINDKSPLNIIYEFSNEIELVKWITFGTESDQNGQLLEFNVGVNYNNSLNSGVVTLKSFAITFPYGFEIAKEQNDPYAGSISSDKKTYTISNKTLDPSKKIALLIKKVTFNPAVDQTKAGELEYRGDITYISEIEVSGTSTGAAGSVDITFAAGKQLAMKDGEFDTNTISAESPKEQTPLQVSQNIGTDMVKSLSSVKLDKPTPINIIITEQGMPAKVDEIVFEDYQIVFPEFLEFEDAEINRTKTLNLKGEKLKRGQPYSKVINVIGYKFAANPITTGGNIELDGNVKTQGLISIPALENVRSTDISSVTIQPKVSIDVMSVKTITGVIQPDMNIEPITINIELDKDMDFIKDCNVDLDRIAMQLAVNNTAQVSSDISITLTPQDENNQPITENIVTQNTGLSVAAQSQSNIWLSNSQVGMPEGFTFVENKQINHLLRKIPSTIVANIELLQNNNEATIDITNQEEMKLDVNYEIVAPLAVGQDFKIVYNESITNLQQDLKDVLEYINSLDLAVKAVNEIPLDLLVSAIAQDSHGNPIDVTVVVDGALKAADKSGAAVTSQTKITITERTKGELKKLDQIKLGLKGDANATVAGAQLKESQTISLSASARIPGGLTIKL